jgi:hypothetical protein
MSKGATLANLGRSDEAIAVFDDVLANFGGAEDESLNRIANDAAQLRQQQLSLQKA